MRVISLGIFFIALFAFCLVSGTPKSERERKVASLSKESEGCLSWVAGFLKTADLAPSRLKFFIESELRRGAVIEKDVQKLITLLDEAGEAKSKFLFFRFVEERGEDSKSVVKSFSKYLNNHKSFEIDPTLERQVLKKLSDFVKERNHALIHEGRKEKLKNITLLGELGGGDRGIVYLGKEGKEWVTVKWFDSSRKTQFEWEAKWFKEVHKILPEHTLKPRQILLKEQAIVFDYVEGVPDNVWFKLYKDQEITLDEYVTLIVKREEVQQILEDLSEVDLEHFSHYRHFGSFLLDLKTKRILYVDES